VYSAIKNAGLSYWQLQLSARAYHRVLKLARTIADLVPPASG
jgi:predicted ATPase with chaperone activity